MKLKDIFPKWLLRERAYGELELGGSAFAHLSEHAAGTDGVSLAHVVVEDGTSLFVGTPNTDSVAISPYGVQINQDTFDPNTILLALFANDDDDNRFRLSADGSLHWGSGAAAPDASLSRLAVGVLGLEATGLVIGAADNYWNGDSTRPTTDLSTPGLIVLANSGGAYSAIGTAAQGILDIRGNGNGIRLHSPNGTKYDITVANDGTVTSTAA